MRKNRISLILLPTLDCNAACEYCFEDAASTGTLPVEKIAPLVQRVVDFMGEKGMDGLTIHWQGGEVMTLSPGYFEQAHTIVSAIAEKSGLAIDHCLQSNMMGYHAGWDRVIAQMFGNSVGSSLDFPNPHRKMAGGSAANYNARWVETVARARAAGIDVGVIAIPNTQTLSVGADRFYTYFTETCGITDFQLNTPFPGGRQNDAKSGLPLDTADLARFLCALCDLWIARGYGRGIKIGPFDSLIAYFLDEPSTLPCIWGANCADELICVDPAGHLSQCDCWAASYPQFRFGNIFEGQRLSHLLETSAVRRRFISRPASLIAQTDCIACDYLALCHGGCPIRTYSVYGRLVEKDPYCDTYRALFKHVEQVAAGIAQRRSGPLADTSQPGL